MKKFCVCGLMCAAVLWTAGCRRHIEIIAHRGASYLAPENTMASVMLAWDKGADVEVDVYLTKDNRIVVIHDKTTKRTGDRDLKVAETDSQELRKVDVGGFKSEQYVGEKIPFLAEVVATIPAGRKLYVEIKSGPEILPFLVRVIDDSGKRSQIVMIAFDFDTIVAAKKRMPDIPAYWLKGTEKDKVSREYIRHDVGLVEKVQAGGLDGLDLHYGGVSKELVDAARAAGQKLYVWTVDDAERAMRLGELGVSGLTTNRPGWLKEELGIGKDLSSR